MKSEIMCEQQRELQLVGRNENLESSSGISKIPPQFCTSRIKATFVTYPNMFSADPIQKMGADSHDPSRSWIVFS